MGLMQARRRFVDYDRYVGSAVAVAAADGVTFTELIRIRVPSDPGRIRVDFTMTVQATTAGQQTSFLVGLIPVGGNVFNMRKGHARLNVGAASGTNAEPQGREVTAWTVLPPNSGGEYMLAATRTTANAGGMLGTSLIPTELLAERLEV